jgi:hypothetical protein
MGHQVKVFDLLINYDVFKCFRSKTCFKKLLTHYLHARILLFGCNYLQCLADFQRDGLEANCRVPGVHDAENPEYSILKQRLARQLKSENCNPSDLDLVSITKAAERTITNVSACYIQASTKQKISNALSSRKGSRLYSTCPLKCLNENQMLFLRLSFYYAGFGAPHLSSCGHQEGQLCGPHWRAGWLLIMCVAVLVLLYKFRKLARTVYTHRIWPHVW